MIRLDFVVCCTCVALGVALAAAGSLTPSPASAEPPQREVYVNSIGMRMLPIRAGSFRMGNLHANLDQWDEQPVHRVTISQPFFISESEVTVHQFQQFRPGVRGSLREEPFVTGISWHDAVAFCQWLSRKEGKPYRLPTEAEWEYCARAGTDAPFWSGAEPPPPGAANRWGLKVVHNGAREWVHDWYGPYPGEDQTDPIGPAGGCSRVVRGGGLDLFDSVYQRSANRASHAPAFAMMAGTEPKTPGEQTSEDISTEPTLEGLIGVWYGRANFEEPKALDHMPTLKVDWNDFQQPGEDRENKWSAQWEGTLVGPTTGTVTFHIASDHGARLVINGQPVIDWAGEEANRSGSVRLKHGKRYRIEMRYVHNLGPRSYINVTWSWEGHEAARIPKANLLHAPAQTRKWRRLIPLEIPPGHHPIGFRVVQAPMPRSEPGDTPTAFFQQAVVEDQPRAAQGPDPAKPWFRQRSVMPIPPDFTSREATIAVGLHPAIQGYLHNPGLVVYPNGDVMSTYFSARPGPRGENQPNVLLVANRLRFGAEQWGMPELFVDFADVNDTSSFLFREKGVVYLFWGHTFNDARYPFQWMASEDLGTTWGSVHFPRFVGEIGPYTPQPINTAIRHPEGSFYLPSDGKGGSSVLWATEDNMRTWFDTGGRTFGRHTCFVLLGDGRILGMGGKKTDIDQFMPKSISSDHGKSWQISRTPFPALGSGQRPTLLRLQSGRLFFAGDYRHRETGKQPEGYTEDGAYVALSADDGATWRIKLLPGTLLNFRRDFPEVPVQKTIGYAVACQAPNGLIHLVGSRTQPNQHWELNEAWILSDAGAMPPAPNLSIDQVEQHASHYPNGQLKARFGGGVTTAGQYRLHGPQVHCFADGSKQWQAVYQAGKKVGAETLWDRQGRKRWTWLHGEDETSVWAQYWPDGKPKAKSSWRSFRAHGRAQRWDHTGKLLSDVQFSNGELLD